MKHLIESHKYASNVIYVLRFQQTLLGTQTNPNKSQKKLKIGPTMGYHILNAPMSCFIFQMVVFLNKGFKKSFIISRNQPKCNQSIYDYMQLIVLCNYIWEYLQLQDQILYINSLGLSVCLSEPVHSDPLIVSARPILQPPR